MMQREWGWGADGSQMDTDGMGTVVRCMGMEKIYWGWGGNGG